MTESAIEPPVDTGGRADESLLDAALPYVPRVLVSALERHPSAAFPWTDEIDGTLVMADISGFTAMSEQLAASGREGAEQLTDIITSFFTSMLDRARVFGGDTITYGGDAMLLLFTGPKHRERAVAASLAMLETMRGLAPFRVGRRRISLGMSMGAHSDRFPVFGAGTPERAQFFILGPATVRTAECEALANSGELVVSEAVREGCFGLGTRPAGDGLFLVTGLDPAPDALAAGPAGSSCEAPDLLPYLPPFAADALARGETPQTLDSDHRKATVVFVNVLGVDGLLAEGRDALAAELQSYVEIMLAVLERHGGYLVSNDIYTNGFKLIAAFGAPVALEDDAEKASRFAIELRDAVAAAHLRLTQRIGINRGDVFAGDVGPEYRRQYTVMGDAVNLSARLMSAATPGQVMTTCEVARSAGDRFAASVLQPITVKGKAQPIDVCLLSAEVTQGGEEVRRHPLVGRSAEIARMGAAERAAREGEVRAVAILGDAGSGKSHLVAAASDVLAASGWRIVRGTSYAHTAAMPFTPWSDLLKCLLRLEESATADAAAQRLRETVSRVAPRQSDLACLVGQLVGLDVPETARSRALDASGRRAAMFSLVRDLVLGISCEEAVCLVLEDLQWADGSSLELLEYVAAPASARAGRHETPGGMGGTGGRTPGRTQLLAVASSRPDLSALAALEAVATDTVELRGLADNDALALVSEAVGAELPAEFASVLLRKSEGNPLFLLEVARSIVESGVLRRIGAAASAVALEEALASIDVPDRVQGLLLSRIDHLDPGHREVLKTASVIGTTFPVDGVLAIAEREFTQADEAAVRRRFDDLVAMEFLLPAHADERAGASELNFAQPLLQEVAYNSLRFSRRRGLHHAYAEYLEQLPEPDSRLGALVLHCSRAGEREKTARYSVKASQAAGTLFAHRESLDYLRMALGSIGGSTPGATWERSCVVERAGDVHESWGHHRDAIRAYKDALRRWSRVEGQRRLAPPHGELADLLISTAPTVRRASLWAKIGASQQREGRRYDLAERSLDAALAALPKACTAERAGILAMKGSAAMRQGRYDDAIRLGRRALKEARACGDDTQRAMSLTMLGNCYREVGQLDKAIECEVESVSLFEKLEDLPHLGQAHGNLASCYHSLGRLEDARRENEACLEINERVGSVSSATITRVNLTEILIEQHRFDEARSCLWRTLAGCDETGAVGLTGYAYLMAARLHAGEGDLEEARADIARSIELLDRVNALGPLFEAYIDAALIALRSDDLRGAGRAIERAAALEEPVGSTFLDVRLDRARGLLAGRLQHLDEAHASLWRSAELAREIQAEFERSLSLLAMAEVAGRARELGAAWPERRSPARFASDAVRILEGCGADAELERGRMLAHRLSVG